MATPEELLRKLDERFIMGEITDEQYQQFRARLQSQSPPPGTAGDPSPAPATAGGMDIADSVIKGNVTSGSASVGNINIHVGQPTAASGGNSSAELEYEKYILLALHAGGALEGIRRELDERRLALGLPIRLAREIEEACLASCGRRPGGPAPGAAAGPGAAEGVSRLLKSASASLATMFGTHRPGQPAAPAPGVFPPAAPPRPIGPAAPAPGFGSAPVPRRPPPLPLPRASQSPVPTGPPAPADLPAADSGAAPPLETAVKAGLSELRAELKAELAMPVEPDAPPGPGQTDAEPRKIPGGEDATPEPAARPKPPPLPPRPPLPKTGPARPDSPVRPDSE